MASLMPQGKQQYFDSNSNELSGGRVYTYAAGTSTPLATFSDAAGAVPNTNPVVLNARGEATIFWADSSYKVVLKDASDVEIWSQDNLRLTQYTTTGETVTAALDARLPEIGTYALLRAYTGPLTAFYVRGFANMFDGGHGVFRVDSADTTSSDDFGTILVGSDGRRWKREFVGAISPTWFGAVGDGATDDGVAMNRALSYLRNKIDTASNAITVVKLDLANKIYATTISLNATGLREGWEITNGMILGKCTGKAVLDIIGSRAGRLTNLTVRGDQTNRPSVGIQAARGSASPEIYGFCDGMLFDKVFTNGWFSTAAIHMYGQEGSTYTRCKFWNSDKDAYIAIHSGFSTVAMSSDYRTPTTGAVSYINNKYMGVDYLHLPVNASATITGITQANPAVVTATGHPFNNGDVVVIGLVNGMTQINNFSATVANKTTNTFELTGVNSSGFSAYTSGGQAVVAQTKPSILFERGEQHHWDTCYIVNYGSDSVEIGFPGGHEPRSVWFDALFEGAGSRSHVRFSDAGTIYGFKLHTYNTHCRDYIMSVGGTVGTVALYEPEIVVTNLSVGAPVLVSDAARFALYAADVHVPNSTVLSSTTLADRFVGTLRHSSTGDAANINSKYSSTNDGTFVPTVTASSGTITSYTPSGSVKYIGNLVFFQVKAVITDNGTGAGNITITLPFTNTTHCVVAGREYGISGHALTGIIGAGSATISIARYDGSYPAATGATILCSGVCTI